MTTTCKYCNEPENKQDRPGLICDSCICFVHLACLRRTDTPGNFSCDVFFDFNCEDCSPDKKEVFTRNRFPWVNVILLTLHHLSEQSYGISNHGFFHYKTHICSFIDRNWNLLFGVHFKQKKNWVGTIAGALSVYNNLFFRSGSIALGETGWWKLLHAFSPAVAAHIIQEMARDKPKGRPRNQMALDKTLFIAKVTEMGYREQLTNDMYNVPIPGLEPAPKKRRVDSDELSGVSSASCYDQFDSDSRNEVVEEGTFGDSMAVLGAKDGSYSDVEGIFRGFEFAAPPSDSSSIHSLQQVMYYDSDSQSGSPSYQPVEQPYEEYEQKPFDTNKPVTDTKIKKTVSEEQSIVKRESLFSTQLNSTDMPWMEEIPEKNMDLVEVTQYEEIQLLKQVEGLIPKVKDPNKKAYLCRLKAKLALRRLKRHKHLPIFDLDKAVRLLGGYVTEDPRVTINTERVLDRFQRSYLMDNLSGTVASTNYGTLLVARAEEAVFRSQHSGATLKPYIRRDQRAQPLWLRLTDQLLCATNRHLAGYRPPSRAPLDYSYVRPQHIAAVNNLCAQFFWPGIDLTEALQYPEYSCVVTYKRLVVACAFLVPDAGAHRAYISFVLTRPEWRRAGIATFMLYHLLQTCTGKDVTLHVSPTNPSIFLYQKFGFKWNKCKCGTMRTLRKIMVRNAFDGFLPNSSDFEICTDSIPALKKDEFLVKAEYISVDPYMRSFAGENRVPYLQFGFQVGKVVESRNEEYPVGAYVVSHSGWCDFAVLDGSPDFMFNVKPYQPPVGTLRMSLAVGALGMPGMTAYLGLLEVCKPKQGDVVCVTSAAGAVGSIVGQIAKHKGCMVIGFAGSDEKVRVLKEELGFDHAFNYKAVTNVKEAVSAVAPQGIQCFFDNVGGSLSARIMECMSQYGHVAACGAISTYGQVATRHKQRSAPVSIQIESFSFTQWDWAVQNNALCQLADWIATGRVLIKETVATGFEALPDTLIKMLKGDNVGKSLVQI